MAVSKLIGAGLTMGAGYAGWHFAAAGVCGTFLAAAPAILAIGAAVAGLAVMGLAMFALMSSGAGGVIAMEFGENLLRGGLWGVGIVAVATCGWAVLKPALAISKPGLALTAG